MFSNDQINQLKDVFATKDDLNGIKEELKSFATKDDVKSIRDELKGFATKDDLKAFAKKKDLEKFATKKDLEKFATKKDLEAFAKKKDLEKFATKKEHNALSEKVDRLSDVVIELHKSQQALGVSLQTQMTESRSDILTAIDGITQRLDTKEVEDAATTHRLHRHEKWITEIADHTDLKLSA